MFKYAFRIFAFFALMVPPIFCQTGKVVPVNAGNLVNVTRVLVAQGQTVSITATGTITMTYAGGGSFTCDPYGDIITPPDSSSAAYTFLTNEPPKLEPPGPGKIKFPSSGGLPANGPGVPYGGLVAGVSAKSNASSVSDFPNGFFAIGGENAFLAPITGFLYLAVNTNILTAKTSDLVTGSGSFTAAVTVSGAGAGGSTGLGLVEALDPDATLFAGSTSAITTDPLLLASSGRPVTGVAADGVAQVVIRASGVSSTTVPVVVILDENGQIAPATGEDGALSLLNGGFFATSTVVAPAFQNINGNNEGFVVYTPPIDYARTSADWKTAARLVSILLFDTKSGKNLAFKTLQIMRPPIFFVHGLWGDPGTWDQFDPFLTTALPGLSTFRADFAKHNGDSVGANTPDVLRQAYNHLAAFRAANQAAASQFDFIVHSMGGLISDTMPTLPSFKTPNNYGQGIIHKLITVDTPYQGSPFAAGLEPSSFACKRWMNKFGAVVGGAVDDLVPGSPFLQNFNPTPTGYAKHAIASYVTTDQAQFAEILINGLFLAGNTNPLTAGVVDACYSVFKTPFDSAPPTFTFTPYFAPVGDPYDGASDLIVSVVSQLGPYIPGSTAERTNGLAHSHLVLPFMNLTAIPGSLDSDVGTLYPNPVNALSLLNSPTKSFVFVQ